MIAAYYGHLEAAKILSRKGAICTKEEMNNLGKRFTDMQQALQEEEMKKGFVQAGEYSYLLTILPE